MESRPATDQLPATRPDRPTPEAGPPGTAWGTPSPDDTPAVDLTRAPDADAPALRALVADDFDPLRGITRRMLTNLGHEVDEARDGHETIEALTTRPYDLLLLDLAMPGLNGMDVIRWMSQHPEHSDGVHVVVVSAWAGEERPALNQLGVTTILPKPFRHHQLTEVLDTLTGDRP